MNYSELDSKRFNLKIYRGALASIDIDSINECINNKNPDVIIFRVPVEKSNYNHLLNSIGQPFFLADTLVYYYCDLIKYKPIPITNNLEFREVNVENKETLISLIPIIFKNYQNHYFSNPLLDKGKIIEGYLEWALSYINDLYNNRFSWIVYEMNTPIGFATCSLNKSKNESEGILYGVHPDYSGKGVYSDIIRFTQHFFQRNGIPLMKVSTQIQNYAVQKIWNREGFYLKEAFSTYHINVKKNDSL